MILQNHPHFWIIFIFLLLIIKISHTYRLDDEGCLWKKYDKAPEIYFINMDKSGDRKISMEKHLKNIGLTYKRIRGNPWDEIYIPSDLEKFWTTAWCKSQTNVQMNFLKLSSIQFYYIHHNFNRKLYRIGLLF